jgi:hypothetical protein
MVIPKFCVPAQPDYLTCSECNLPTTFPICCRGLPMRLPSIMLWIVPLLLAAPSAFGADFTRAQVEAALATAPESPRPSFNGRSLVGLDLHELDLHGVDLTSADLSGADLSDADLRGAKLVATKLTGANLRRAKLNLAWIMGADFSHADLSQSILETLVASAG